MQELLDAATAHLLQTAQARAGRVVLTWKYGGLTAQVCVWGGGAAAARCVPRSLVYVRHCMFARKDCREQGGCDVQRVVNAHS